jgi:DNA-binding transcriptional ArsR family regulator
MPLQSSQVLLIPLLCSPDSEVLHTKGGFAREGNVAPVFFGYPVAGVHQWLDPSTRPLAPDSRDRVVTLLGPSRASVFRAAKPPVTMGALARTLDIAPSTASHHVAKLVESGLLASYQVGKEVWVGRTAAGDQLLNLLD